MMSANVVGIGHQNLIKVPCDSDGKMKPESLLEEIDWAKSNGMIPFCIITTSGTTVRGSFDQLGKLPKLQTIKIFGCMLMLHGVVVAYFPVVYGD